FEQVVMEREETVWDRCRAELRERLIAYNEAEKASGSDDRDAIDMLFGVTIELIDDVRALAANVDGSPRLRRGSKRRTSRKGGSPCPDDTYADGNRQRPGRPTTGGPRSPTRSRINPPRFRRWNDSPGFSSERHKQSSICTRNWRLCDARRLRKSLFCNRHFS